MAITFTDPWYLWLIALIPLFVVTHFYAMKFVKLRALRLANFEAMERVSGKKRVSINWFILILRVMTVLMLIFAAAGMIFWYKGNTSDANYILAIDASGSMLADDFDPNRLEAAKEAAKLFVDSAHVQAKIGVISFAGIGEVESRLSINKFDVKQAIDTIAFKSIHGTAIGNAVRTSLNLFADTNKPRIVVLLTDGRENVLSEAELLEAIDAATEDKATIYTIGVGTSEGGIVPGLDITSTIDDSLLTQIAAQTGGEYFRVEDKEALVLAYQDIATRSVGEVPIPLRVFLIVFAIFLIFFEWGLLNTKYKTIP